MIDQTRTVNFLQVKLRGLPETTIAVLTVRTGTTLKSARQRAIGDDVSAAGSDRKRSCRWYRFVLDPYERGPPDIIWPHGSPKWAH
jgi:hypothetical protein